MKLKRKAKAAELEDELRPEYDLRKLKFVGRGIYAKRFRSGTNVALLDRDVREAFPDDKSVNEVFARDCNRKKTSEADSKEFGEGSTSAIAGPFRQSPSCVSEKDEEQER